MGLTKGYQARILKLNSLDAHLAIKLLKKSTCTFKPCIHSENNHNVLQFSVPLSVEEKKMKYMEKCNEANLYIWILHIRFSRCKKGKKKKKNEHNVLPFSVPLSLNKRKCEVRGKMQWSFTYEYKPYSIASYVLHIHFRIKLSIIVLQFSVPLFIREKNRVLGKMHWS